jgi:Fe-S-cluster containining protein
MLKRNKNLDHKTGPLPKMKKNTETALTNEYDCQSCGACCSHFFDEYLSDLELPGICGKGLLIANKDVSKIPAKLVVIDIVRLHDTKVTLQESWLRGKRVTGRWQCRALKGTIGEKCSCSIYDVRPKLCREFEPGSQGCLVARDALLGKRRANGQQFQSQRQKRPGKAAR